MPELPEVEIIKRSLIKIANNAKIINIKINNKQLRYEISKKFRNKLVNKKIIKIVRRSKYIIFHFNNRLLLLHLGMTGKLLIIRKKDNQIFRTSFYYNLDIIPKHNHIYFTLNNGFILIYNDIRRFGFFKLYEGSSLNTIKFLKNLGPEPLGKNFNIKYFCNFIKNKKKNIKNLLMDQKFVSGLGNIYVNEALFMAQIHPMRLSFDLKKTEVIKLIYHIKSILKLSILKGGSTIKDFKNSLGKSGNFQQFFRVYGKESAKCSRISCNGKIKKIVISNRSSFFCNKCQN